MLLWNTQQDVKIIGQRSIFSLCLEYIGASKATFWIPINFFIMCTYSVKTLN